MKYRNTILRENDLNFEMIVINMIKFILYTSKRFLAKKKL